MAQFFSIHTDTPHLRLIRQAVSIVRNGGIIVYPTDSCYALGCHLGDKDAMTRIRTIRQVDERHHFTLVCRNLAEISTYAKVDNSQYRLLKATTPGSYTFILQATREVPRRMQHPKRNTIGLRIPDHPAVLALLQELDDATEIRERLEHQVDLVMDAGSCGIEMTTVIDLTTDVPELIRQGRGSIEPFGISHG